MWYSKLLVSLLILFAQPLNAQTDSVYLWPGAVPDETRAKAKPVTTTGERMVTKWQFRDLLNLGAASLLQPDITHCGGITEMKAIATLAESHYAGMLPHAKEGIVGAIASMHVMASIPNFVAHEIPNLQAAPKDKVQRSYLGKSYIKKPLVMTEGNIIIKGNIDGPGLGLELDEDLIENERGVKEWEFPEMWDSFDGSVLDH